MKHRHLIGEGDAWEADHGKSVKAGKGAAAKRMTAKRERREAHACPDDWTEPCPIHDAVTVVRLVPADEGEDQW